MELVQPTGEQVTDLSATAGEQAVSPSPEPVGQQAIDPSPEDLLETALSGAFDGAEIPTPPTEEPATQQPLVQQPPVGAGQQVAQPAPETPEAPAWSQAPDHWPLAEKEQFDALPEGQRQFIYNTVTSASRAANEKMEHAAEMRKTVADFVNRLPVQNQPQAQQQAQTPAVEERPDDPIESIKYDAKQEIRAELAQERQAEAERVRAATAADILTKVKADPLQTQTRQVIDSKVMAEPAIVDQRDPQGRTYQQIEFDRLNSDPVYFAEIYTAARNIVTQQMGTQQAPAPQPTGQPQQAPAPQAQAQPRQTRAPRLEQAGTQAPVTPINPAMQKRQDIANSVRRGKASATTLGSYLDAVVGDGAFG